MIDKEVVKQECIRRMKKLKIHDDGEFTCLGAFRKTGEVWKSESLGYLYWLDDDEQKIVAEFENKNKGYKVYHCIRSYTEFGELLTLLYVNGANKECFDEDKEYFDYDIDNGFTFAYVKNLDSDFCSEFGSIALRSINGGVQRIG